MERVSLALLWAAQVLLALAIACQALQYTGPNSASVRGELELQEALLNSSINFIYLASNITMTRDLWPKDTVVLNRSVSIRAESDLVPVFWDVNRTTRGAVACRTAGCNLLLAAENLFFINNFDEQPPNFNSIPTFLQATQNGKITLATFTNLLSTPNAWFKPDNVAYDPNNTWWVGELKVQCRSEKEVYIQLWHLDNDLRLQVVYGPSSKGTFTGYTRHLQLSQKMREDAPWTDQDCRNMVQVCANLGTPLSNASCQTKDRAPPWWAWLILVLGVGMILVAAAVAWVCYRRQRVAGSMQDERSSFDTLPDHMKPALCNDPSSRGQLVSLDLPHAFPKSEVASNCEARFDSTSADEGALSLHFSLGGSGRHATELHPFSLGNPLGIQVECMLGKGACGAVYKARWNGMLCAVKVIQDLAVDEEGQARSPLAEADICTRVQHPNVVKAYTSTLTHGEPGSQAHNMCEMQIVMEYCEYGTLQEQVNGRSIYASHQSDPRASMLRLDDQPSTSLSVLIELADALHALHSQGIVHGDLKLSNVLLTSAAGERGWCTKLADFGYSMEMRKDKTHTTLSQPHGTVTYMAPEMLSCYKLSPAADVYAFGVIAWEMVARSQAFKGKTVPQIIYIKTLGGMESSLPFPDGCAPQLISLIQGCWNEAPASRPDMAHVLQALKNMQNNLQASAKGESHDTSASPLV